MLTQILKVLENDARTSLQQIATITGLSEAEVAQTVKKAEQDQVILKYKAIINWEKVQNEHVFALIEVKVTPQRDVGFDSIAERIYRFPQAHTVYLLSGTFDLLVIVTGRTIQEVANFVSQKLAPVEGVQSTVTHFLLKKYKEDGEILGNREDLKRQPFIL
ncbi:MAG: transcriptional regulator, AsnC family [Chloroflexi bacterium]|jgi:DNA-binding Lrp family transcriptional regulator|nr:transcriptional regulator, AsnC family [Chloroflexota bacterium]